MLDPRAIVGSRVGVGGAAPEPLQAMVDTCRQRAAELGRDVERRRERLDRAEHVLLQSARRLAEAEEER